MSKPNHDDLIRKKDKPPIKAANKLAPQTEPIKLETSKKQPPKQPSISSSPSKNKLYQHVAPRVQSKLPVSFNQKKNDNSNATRSKPNTKQINETSAHDKSSLLSTDINSINSLQPSLSSTSLSSTTTSSSSDDEELNRLNQMLEQFRTAKETSPTYLSKQIESTNTRENKLEQDSGDESSKANEIDIENLKNRLNNLRQKLFKNYDYEESNSDLDSAVKANTQLDLLNKDRPPIQPKSVKQTSKQPIMLEASKFNSSNKLKTSIPNINIESIDFKAKQLIEKSESSLSERVVSSDGLGSSRSTSSMMSTLSSNFQETQPYKPEFLKYLESKNKIGTSTETDEIRNPEDDILYQWRLRRKLEEAKKLSPIPEPSMFESLPIKKLSATQPQETQISPLRQQTLITPTKQSTQTQTVCDSAVQTSLDLNGLPSINSIPKLEKLNEIETQTDFSEKPTRDVNHLESEFRTLNNKEVQNEPPTPASKLKIKSSDHLEKPKKSNFSSSSPIRSKSKYLLETNDLNNLKSLNNLSADLTRVSSINENTTNHAPKTSNSPIIFNNNPPRALKKPQTNSVASSNLYSISTASMTVVTASTDSKSTRASPTNMDQTILISSEATNRKTHEINENSCHSNNYSIRDEYDYIQSEMIESDEILRILLKKNYFYRLKLKQIDELLTK